MSDTTAESFASALVKIEIHSLEPQYTNDPKYQVKAQYNPKELQIDKSVPWSKVNEANKSNSGSDQAQGIHLEFTGAEGRSMSIELFFDAFEPMGFKESEKRTFMDVYNSIKILEKLASVITPGSPKADLRRPHRCMVTYGKTIESFRCVIESLSTKYSMFDKDGNPLRATCTLKLKEADVVSMAKKT